MRSLDAASKPDSGAQEREPGRDAARSLTSAELFCGASEVLIRHQDQIYRLVLTRNGKLLLNK